MIVNYLNVLSISINPTETNPKLIINANAMLASAVAF